jgi:hypothetical protein
MAVFWDIAACSVALMMEAVSISETLVNFCETTWRNFPEDCGFHSRRH